MKKISIILTGAVLLCSCAHDLDLNIPNDTIGFSSVEVEKTVSVLDESATVSVIKSGKGFSTAKVTIATATAADVQALNTDTPYAIIPENLYTINNTTLSFGKSDVRKSFNVTWNKEQLATFCKQQTTAKPVIPIAITSCNADLDSTRMITLVYPHVPVVSFESIDIKNVSPQEKKDVNTIVTGKGKVVLDNTISEDTQVSVAVDYSLVAGISAERAIEYTQAPDGLIKLSNKDMTIKAGETSASFDYTVDCSVLFTASGKFKYPVCKFIAPVKIATVSPSVLGKGTISVACIVVHLSASGVIDPPAAPSHIIFSDGTWEVIEGMEQDMAHDPLSDNPSWYSTYNCQKLVDGSLVWHTGAMGNQFWSPNVFPITYVIDLKKSYIFKGFRLIDAKSHQNQYRHLHVWVAEEYFEDGSTVWFDACEGTRTFKGGWQQWPDANQTVEGLEKFTYHMPEDSDPECTNSFTYRAGRYIKLQLVEPTNTEGDYVNGRGYLMEFYAEGWDNE